jgi:hypothetical protein
MPEMARLCKVATDMRLVLRALVAASGARLLFEIAVALEDCILPRAPAQEETRAANRFDAVCVRQ